jgi:photosystem II stability/assembly factor-like uncharacterized protein
MIPLLSLGAALAAPQVPFDAGVLSGLPARNIGSAEMSGRIAALAAVNDSRGRTTIFVGAASGGVWKSTDGGTTFRPVFDDASVQSIGAVALDPNDPLKVWVGTGEAWTRNSVSFGDGVYRSLDGGETWAKAGLPKSERVSRILVDPRASDTALACVPGALWSDSPDRGLYRTTDGGATWSLLLKGTNLSTGCGDVARDPTDPDVLFASTWDFRRKAWTFRSGGEGPDSPSGSGLFRSVDGGVTWADLSGKGLPPKPWGRVAVTVAPSDHQRVYAFIESASSALYISQDGGQSWERGDDSQWMVWRPFYFANLIVDPHDADVVYKTNGALIRSEDGGRSFTTVGGFSGMHGDVHDVWIDPANPAHVIAGDDGGLFHSYDGGNRWWKGYNLPISQFYHVDVDRQDPFHVYGGLQDNGSWVSPSEHPGGIGNPEWQPTCWGDGFYSFADPTDPNFVYCEAQGGYVYRYNLRTKEQRDIQPKPALHRKLRFNWNTPLALSPHDPATLYVGAQFLFRSRDQGQSWERLSPDLTTNDPQKQRQEESGGVTVDNSAAEMHTTLTTIHESERQSGLIWVGTDDGRVQVTRDHGGSWQDATPKLKGVPAGAWVTSVRASRFDPATALATLDRHTAGDFEPYVVRTTDFGASWKRVDTRGVRGWAHIIAEDTKHPDLLFLGTELGLWVSIDRGASWAAYQGSQFPAVAVRDLALQPDRDALVLATHGRGIWIIDDIAPLRGLSAEVLQREAALLTTSPVQQRLETYSGRVTGAATFFGPNPPSGAVITYYQRSRHLFGKLGIEILDAEGTVIDRLPASSRRGLNRVTWSMHLEPPPVPPAASVAGSGTSGPRVLPGEYTVRLSKNGRATQAPLVIVADPRTPWTPAERQARFDAAMDVYALFRDQSALFGKLVGLRSQLSQLPAEGRPAAAAAFDAELDVLRKEIVATKEGGAITGEERLRERTDQLYGAILSWEGPPAQYQVEAIGTLGQELAELQARFDALTTHQLPALNQALSEAGRPALRVPEPEVPESGGSAPAPGEREAEQAGPAWPSWGLRPWF